MSSARRHRVAALAWALTLATPIARAQDDAPQRPARDMDVAAAWTRARFLRAAHHAAETKAVVDSLQADLRRRQTRDTLRAGVVTVLVVGDEMPRGDREHLALAVHSVWSVIRAYHDTTLEAAVAAEPLEVTAHPRVAYPAGHVVQWQYDVRIPKAYSLSRSLGRSIDAGDARNQMLRLFGSTIGARLPMHLAAWLGDSWLDLAPQTPTEWQDVRIRLATSRSSVARTCVAGDVPACITALAASGEHLDDPLHAWYTARDITGLVAGWSPTDSALRALRGRCVSGGIEADCEAAARKLTFPVPAPNSARQSLAMTAVARGGPNAISRLIAAGDRVPDGLQEAAGEPLNALAAAWRDSVAAAPLPRTLPGPGETFGIIAWTVAFGAAATWRRR